MLKEKNVALGLILCKGNILIIERRDKNPMWDHKWEFPGGKVDPGETHHETVKREILEETGLALDQTTFLGVHSHDWHLENGDVLRVHLHCHLGRTEEENIQCEEEHAYSYQWVNPKSLEEWDLLEANLDLAKNLLWPLLENQSMK